MAQTLSELDTKVQHLAQHKINQILFQAQTGLLAQESPYGSMVPIPSQPHFFQRDNSSYSMTGITNQAVSTHPQFNSKEPCPSSHSSCQTFSAPEDIWRFQNIQSGDMQADRLKNFQQI